MMSLFGDNCLVLRGISHFDLFYVTDKFSKNGGHQEMTVQFSKAVLPRVPLLFPLVLLPPSTESFCVNL